MCSVSISEQEVSQLDAVTATIMSAVVTDSVKASWIIMTDAADQQGDTYNLET